MTLHTAKGLEFPVVFLTGMEDGVFPHMRALAEPPSWRRSAGWPTSAITRARERLYLSRAAVRSAWGAPPYNPRVPVPRRDPGRAASSGSASSRRSTRRASGRRTGGSAMESLANRREMTRATGRCST